MATPNSRSTFKDYCLRRLGFPVVDINVDEDQVEDRIDDALIKFQEFHFDATRKDYYGYQMTQQDITNRYIPIPSDVLGVTTIFPITADVVNNGSSVSFNIFDLNYQLRLNELYDFTTSSYTYYWIARSHIRMLEMIITGENPIRFNRKMDRLYIDMNWTSPEVPAGRYVMIECWRSLNPTEYPKVYNDPWLKSYATALIKRQWGENMKKYGNYTLPGGMVINAQTIYDEASAEIISLEETVRDVYEEPPQFIVG